MTEEDISSIKSDEKIVFYCRTGRRSNDVAKEFISQGFSDVGNLIGGIVAYNKLS